MKQLLARTHVRLAAAAYVAVFGCTALLACSGAAESAQQIDNAEESAGSLDVALRLDPTETLRSVGYHVSGPNAFSKSGTIDLTHSSSLTALIAPIPAGTGFTITLTSAADAGSPACTGAATFDITAGHTTSVTVNLTCHEGAHVGSVLLTGSLNICPLIDAAGANPASISIGQSSQLTVTAHDLDHAPSALVYHWTTDLGTLSDAAAASPTLGCTAIGVAHVTVSASDGDPAASCADARNVTVTCTP